MRTTGEGQRGIVVVDIASDEEGVDMNVAEYMHTPDYTHMVGVFEDRVHADESVEALKQAGFGENQIWLTEYDRRTPAKAADLSQEIPASGRLTLVHVQAERREQEAVGIMVQHGANNSRIPAG